MVPQTESTVATAAATVVVPTNHVISPDNDRVDEEEETEKNHDNNTPESNDAAETTTTKKTKADVTTVQERASQLYRGALLAPMVRASTTPLRTLALRYGANAVYTEELMDRSIAATHRVVNETLHTIDYVRSISSAKTKRRLEREQSGAPILLRIDPTMERGRLIGQFGSGEPEFALAAAQHVQSDLDALDLNMGCPKKFSVSGGMGSALLSDPDRASRILRTWRDNFPMKPISAKIRLLSDTDVAPTLDLISNLVEYGGIHAVAIHGRTVGQDSTVPAHWTLLQQVVKQAKAKYPSLSVLVNGDFYTRHEWEIFQQQSGADGVLLARPALFNTSLFRTPSPEQYQQFWATKTNLKQSLFGYQSSLLLDKTTVIQDYVREAVRYDINYKNVKYVIAEMMNNRRAPTCRVYHLKQKFQNQQTISQVCACQSLPEICELWNVNYHNATAAAVVSHYSSNTPSTTLAADNTTLTTNANSSDTNSRSTIIQHGEQAPAGEHKYDDTFLLEKMGPDSSCSSETVAAVSTTSCRKNVNHPTTQQPIILTEETPPNKRTRVG